MPSLNLPVSLFVNHESRSETLLYYFMDLPIYSIPSWDRQPCMVRPLCLNPNIDSAYVEVGDHINFDMGKWLKYLKERAPRFLTTIRSLEVRNIGFWDPVSGHWEFEFVHQYFEVEDTILSFFPNLETLCFTSKNLELEDLSSYPRMMREAQRSLDRQRMFQQSANTWYEEQKAKEKNDEGLKLRTLKIICRPWTKLSRGSFDPYADEEEL
jgi:hypothetical protein